MKKNVKVFSASDFSNATSSVVIDNCYWVLDNVDFTEVGAYSSTPLFELQLKQVVSATEAPNGLRDLSMEMVPNRTFYVREGRPLYNKLAKIWEDLDGEEEDVRHAILNSYANGAFRGRVEGLNGISYTHTTKRGTTISRSRAEFWYPEYLEEGVILDDFVYLCNKGVYVPILEDKPADPVAEALKGLDPKIIAAIKAMK